MKKLQKRILAALLVFVMTLALVPFSVSATATDTPTDFEYILTGQQLKGGQNASFEQTTDNGILKITATAEKSGELLTKTCGSAYNVFKGRYLVVKYRISAEAIGTLQIYTNTVVGSHTYSYNVKDEQGNQLYAAYKLNPNPTDTEGESDKYLNKNDQPVAKSKATKFPVIYTDAQEALDAGYELLNTPYTKGFEISTSITLTNDKGKEGGAQWHVDVVDLDALLGTKVISDEYGKDAYTLDLYDPTKAIQYLRLDLLNDGTKLAVGDTVEYAYVAFSDTLADISAILQAKGDAQYCAHGSLKTDNDGNTIFEKNETKHWNICNICASNVNETAHVVDESKPLEAGATTHTATCKDCGERFSAPHNGNGILKYNGTTRKYDRLCECGGVNTAGETYFHVKKEYDQILTNSDAVKNLITDDGDFDYLRVTANADDGDFYWVPFTDNNRTAETGRYFVMKYRLPATGETKNANTQTLIYTSTTANSAAEGQNFYAKMNNDGEWHLLVVDLAAKSKAVTQENGVYSINFLRLGFGTEKAGANVVDIAYLAFTADKGAIDQYVNEFESSLKVKLEENQDNCGNCVGNGDVKDGVEKCIFCGADIEHKHVGDGKAVASPSITADNGCHVETCISCGAEISVAHTEDNVIIENSANGDKHTEHCKVCNSELAAAHTWSKTAEKKDDVYHTYTCACGAVKDEAHIGGGKLVDGSETTANTHVESCSKCGADVVTKHSISDIEWDSEKTKYVGKCSICAEGCESYFLVEKEASSGSAMIEGDVTFKRISAKKAADAGNNYAHVYANGKVESGRYFIMKYRLPENSTPSTNFTAFAGTVVGGNTEARANGDSAGGIGNIIDDGEWHIMIVDLSATAAAKDVVGKDGTVTHTAKYVPDENGKYYTSYIRLGWTSVDLTPNDETDSSFTYMDIDYVAFADDLAAVNNYLKTEEPELCIHTEQSVEKKDDNYVTVCDICKKVLLTSPLHFYIEGSQIADTAKANGKTNNIEVSEDGKYVTFTTPDGKSTSFYALKGGAVETGNYLVIKYSTNVMYLDIFSATVDGMSVDGYDDTWINLDKDENWHISVIDISCELSGDLSMFVPNSDGKYSASYIKLGFESGSKQSYLSIAYVGMSNSLDEIKEFLTEEDLAICDHAISLDEDVCRLCGEVLVEEDTDTETDTDTDTESDTETDTETAPDTDTDTDSDTDTDTETEVDTNVDSEIETDVDIDTGSETVAESDSESDSESGSETEPVAEGGCRSGCKSTLSLGSAAIVIAMMLAGTVVLKKKED